MRLAVPLRARCELDRVVRDLAACSREAVKVDLALAILRLLQLGQAPIAQVFDVGDDLAVGEAEGVADFVAAWRSGSASRK